MKNTFKNSTLKIMQIILVILLLNVFTTVTIDRFMNDDLTETQIFKRIPQTFFWNFTNRRLGEGVRASRVI
jgi:hypothetical protein